MWIIAWAFDRLDRLIGNAQSWLQLFVRQFLVFQCFPSPTIACNHLDRAPISIVSLGLCGFSAVGNVTLDQLRHTVLDSDKSSYLIRCGLGDGWIAELENRCQQDQDRALQNEESCLTTWTTPEAQLRSW